MSGEASDTAVDSNNMLSLCRLLLLRKLLYSSVLDISYGEQYGQEEIALSYGKVSGALSNTSMMKDCLSSGRCVRLIEFSEACVRMMEINVRTMTSPANAENA